MEEITSMITDVVDSMDEAFKFIGEEELYIIPVNKTIPTSIYEEPTIVEEQEKKIYGMIEYKEIKNHRGKEKTVDAVITVTYKCLKDNGFLDTSDNLLINNDFVIRHRNQKLNIIDIQGESYFKDRFLLYVFYCSKTK